MILFGFVGALSKNGGKRGRERKRKRKILCRKSYLSDLRIEMVDFGLVLCGCDVEKWREMRGGGKEGVDEVFGYGG